MHLSYSHMLLYTEWLHLYAMGMRESVRRVEGYVYFTYVYRQVHTGLPKNVWDGGEERRGEERQKNKEEADGLVWRERGEDSEEGEKRGRGKTQSFSPEKGERAR